MTMFCIILVLALVLFQFYQGQCQESIRIGAFNVKTFGKAKMSDPVKAQRIAEITSRYDIMLLQEIRDISGNSLKQLLGLLNRNDAFNMVVSERLGRSSYKEQYAFFYRNTSVKLLGSHQYDDGVDDRTDIFEREPFSIIVSPRNSCTALGLIALHSKPTDAINEINALDNVRKDLQSKWPVQNVMILGDLNADCSYASQHGLAGTQLKKDTEYKWLIESSEDTTTGTSDCAYDRIVIHGKELESSIVKDSSLVYQFEREMNLTDDDMGAISDHYPVEVQITVRLQCDPCSSPIQTCSSPSSPQQYCTCQSGIPSQNSCKQTELWETRSQSCQPICPMFRNVQVRHPSHCGQYVQCFWGFPLVMHCISSLTSVCNNECL